MAVVGGRYRLVEQVGTGGMSVVWRAFDNVLGRQVAVKLPTGQYATDPDLRRGVQREARAVAHLSHPNIGVVYDYGEWRDPEGVTTPYVVMELIDGPSLAQRLRIGTLPWRAAMRVCAQVAAALHAAHSRGLVHRDVKPGNVMLTVAGAKVVDFGLSALFGELVDEGGDSPVLGTAGYMAPERLIGAPVGPAADVYALGVVLFKTLTGRLPWPAGDEAQLLAAHLSEPPEPLPSIDGMPVNIGELYLRCVAKDPAHRPDAREVAVTLSVAAGLPVVLDDADDEDTDAVPGGRDGLEPTTLLPSAADTVPILVAPAAPQQRRRLLSGRPRLAGLVALPVAGVIGWLLLTGGPSRAHRSPHAAPATATAAGAGCTVIYHISADNGLSFAGSLTLDTRQAPPPGGWTLSFELPAQQTFQAAPPATSTQDASHVTVRLPPTGTSPAGASAAVPFTGTYRGANPLPAAFTAGGQPCTPQLLGPSGDLLPSAAGTSAGAATAAIPADGANTALDPVGAPPGIPAGTATPSPAPVPDADPAPTQAAGPPPPPTHGKPSPKPTKPKGQN